MRETAKRAILHPQHLNVAKGSHHRIGSGKYSGKYSGNTVGIQCDETNGKMGSHHRIDSGKYSGNTVGIQWDETNGKMGVSP